MTGADYISGSRYLGLFIFPRGETQSEEVLIRVQLNSINLFITICDYEDNDEKKDIQSIFKRGLPSGLPA